MRLARQILLTLLFIAGAGHAQQSSSGPPPGDKKLSDYLNEQLPSWLQFGGQFRLRFESFGNSGLNNAEDWL